MREKMYVDEGKKLIKMVAPFWGSQMKMLKIENC